MRVLKAVASFVGLLAVIVGVPVLLVRLVGWPGPDHVPGFGELRRQVVQRDFGSSFVIGALAVIGWILWAQVVWATVWELAVNVRRVRLNVRPRRPPWVAAPIGRVVAGVVITIMSVIGSSQTGGVALASGPLHVSHSSVAASVISAPAPSGVVSMATVRTAETPPATQEVTSPTWVVRRGDTLWDIAEQTLGDGSRVDDVMVLNPQVKSATLLFPGEILHLPSEARVPADRAAVKVGVSVPGRDVTVVRGDTLWDLISDHYGHADGDLVWSVATVNGLENPSLIFPGQQIRLPSSEELTRSSAGAEAQVAPVPVELPAPVPASRTELPPPTDSSGSTTEVGSEGDATVTGRSGAEEQRSDQTSTSSRGASKNSSDPGRPILPPPSVTTDDVGQQPAAALPDQNAGGREQVQTEDMLGARWLFGGVAVTSLGLVGAWMTVKRLRNRRRRWLGLADPDRDAPLQPTERERCARGDVAMLRGLVDPVPSGSQGARAVLFGERAEVRFRGAAPVAPDGWEVCESWVQTGVGVCSPAEVLSSAVVTIGFLPEPGREVVLDLLTAGTVSVTGDRVAVERLVCSMLWELAADPLGQPVELIVVGLSCAAAERAANVAHQMTMAEAISVAREPLGDAAQVFLVDPLVDDASSGSLRELGDVCRGVFGRAMVVAGPCEQPGEEISVPSELCALWDDLVLTPPQLPEHVDVQLGRVLDAVDVGRRERSVTSLAVTPDPEAEAVGLRVSVLVDDRDDGGDADDVSEVADESLPGWSARSDSESSEGESSEGDRVGLSVGRNVAVMPDVMLTVCGREIVVEGFEVGRAWPVLFLLAAAGRKMHTNEAAELTGYSTKSLFNAFGGDHALVCRADGQMWLADGVVTDHGWLRHCVSGLAAAMSDDAEGGSAQEWMFASLEALRRIEQAPYAVLPARAPTTKSKRSAWSWVDEFPEDVPARQLVQTELVESALAFAELWLAAPNPEQVRRVDLVGELCRLAATVPFAVVVRQLRDSRWDSGASCLLVMAARVAGDDETLLCHVQQCARELAARESLEASDELADALGL